MDAPCLPLTVLVLEDEPALREALVDRATDLGHRALSAEDGVAGLALARQELPDLLLCDIRLPGLDGLGIFRRLHAEHPAVRTVLMTAFGSVADAVSALKEGAYDYLTKPFDLARVDSLLRNLARDRALREDLAAARAALQEATAARRNLVTNSPAMRRVIARLQLTARTDIPILLTGESGTGKSVLAQLVHQLSGRAQGPLVELNCASIPEALFESELFGHERGAFTGAVRAHPGRVRRADGGTLFLDEIGEMPLPTQPKLLRFLDDGRFEAVGATRGSQADVRLVAATNRDLPELVQEGQFREDLFYRINAMEIAIPPLRERRDDLPLLVQHFVDQGAQQGLPAPASYSPVAWDLLMHHDYPGNVRELRNAVQHMLVVAQGGVVQPEHLPGRIRGATPGAIAASDAAPPGTRLAEVMARVESDHIRRVVTACDGSRSRAAAELGISRKNLWEKMKKYALDDL